MIFLLKRLTGDSYASGMLEVVVRAADEAEARATVYLYDEYDFHREEWLRDSDSSCEVVLPDGEPEVIAAEMGLP